MELCPKFAPLFTDNIEDKRYYQCYGGRGSGKSFAVAVKAITCTYSDYGHRVLYLRQVMATSDDSTIADVRLCIQLMGVEDHFSYKANQFTNLYTGSTISFKGIRSSGSQTAKLKSLSGITTLIMEEAEEIESFEEFSKVDESIRVKGKPLKVILVYNPGSALKSWIHKEWFTNGKPNQERLHDTVYIHTTYKDNLKNLAPSTIKRYEDLRVTNPTYYVHTILAEWTLDSANRVYAGWKEWPQFTETGDITYGLDFGYGGSDSTALIEINHYEGMNYIREIFCESKMELSDIIIAMKKAGIPKHRRIIADGAVPILYSEIRKAGYNVHPANKAGKDAQIKRMQDIPFTIVGENENLYHAYSTWAWDKKGSLPHEPDILAALRYGVMYRYLNSGSGKQNAKTIRQKGGYV